MPQIPYSMKLDEDIRTAFVSKCKDNQKGIYNNNQGRR